MHASSIEKLRITRPNRPVTAIRAGEEPGRGERVLIVVIDAMTKKWFSASLMSRRAVPKAKSGAHCAELIQWAAGKRDFMANARNVSNPAIFSSNGDRNPM